MQGTEFEGYVIEVILDLISLRLSLQWQRLKFQFDKEGIE